MSAEVKRCYVGFMRFWNKERKMSEKRNKPEDARWDYWKNYANQHLLAAVLADLKYEDIYNEKIKEWAAVEGLMKLKSKSKSKL